MFWKTLMNHERHSFWSRGLGMLCQKLYQGCQVTSEYPKDGGFFCYCLDFCKLKNNWWIAWCFASYAWSGAQCMMHVTQNESTHKMEAAGKRLTSFTVCPRKSGPQKVPIYMVLYCSTLNKVSYLTYLIVTLLTYH